MRLYPRLLLLGLATHPLANAIAAVCPPPTEPWSCTLTADRTWTCRGVFERGERSRATPANDAGDLPTVARVERLSSADGQRFRLEGAVEVERGDQRIRTEALDYVRDRDQVVGERPARIENDLAVVYAARLEVDLAADRAELDQVRFALKDGRGEGQAAKARWSGRQQTELEEVRFTSCPGDRPVWAIHAERMRLDHAEQRGRAENFRLEFGGLPLVYLPYASFPLTDRRKSGFLVPNVQFGSGGLDLILPYYLNLAPNYDATLEPRLIARRGLMLGGEARYLDRRQQGQVDLNYLHHDRDRERNRWQLAARHQAQWSPSWSMRGEFNRVSDDRYFDDFGDSLLDNAITVLPSVFGVQGRGRRWALTVDVEDYRIIDPRVPEAEQIDPFQRLPRIGTRFGQTLGPLSFDWRGDLTRFSGDLALISYPDGSTAWQRYDCVSGPTAVRRRCGRAIDAERLDLRPGVALELRGPGYFVRPELAVRHTRYRLPEALVRAPGAGASFPSRNPERTLPIASLDAGLYFDRLAAWGRASWRQTLEPRLYYLRVPFRAQDDLPVFDTTALDFSFGQLFRQNRYSGPDRQSDSDQLTLALTSRLWDDGAGRELARVAVGQVRYFEAPRVLLPGEPPLTRDQSVYVGEAAVHLTERWNGALSAQWDPELRRTRLFGGRVQYLFGERALANLSYRYRAGRFEQVDLSGLLPVDERWTLIGRWNYSLSERQNQEAILGVDYQSCCWRMRVVGRHYLRATGLGSRTAVYVEFELDGLGVVGRKTGDFLARAILGFRDLNP